MLELAILGVLRERRMHGYELRHYLSFIVGHIWPLSYGTLYPALRRLEKRGDLERETVRARRGPAKHVYGLTEAGECSFVRMMNEMGALTEISDPHKFTIRLVFFRYLSPEARVVWLERRLKFLLENRESLLEMAQLPEQGLDLYRRSLIGYHTRLNGDEIVFLEELLAAERQAMGVLG